MSRPIFVDTAFIVALVNQRDQYHQKALQLAYLVEDQATITTDAVLLEVASAIGA